jgi:hypothetical protein
MRLAKPLQLVLGVTLLGTTHALAQNPIIHDKFAADPSARLFGDRMYLFSSHDIPPKPGGRGGFVMEDYHVFSSADLVNWIDHGVILHQDNVNWVNAATNSMWAPDCVFKNGKYYFYFPAIPKDGREKRIGVAIADKPEGPYKPEPNYIPNVLGIDPCILLDKDGSAYLFWSLNDLFCAKLKPNMLEIEGETVVFKNLRPADNKLLEGPFVFERNGKYYLTYPRARSVESIDYAMSDNPMGPYTYMGIIMDEHASGCWTNHHSIVEFKGQWYFFHHDRLMSASDTNRSAMIDYLAFNEDGTIQKVVPTLRGVGITLATSRIQIDRYSDCAGNARMTIARPARRGGADPGAPVPNTITTPEGVVIAYLDPRNFMGGWKTILSRKDAWIRYNAVDFGRDLKSVNIQARSENGATIDIRLDKPDSAPIATAAIGKLDDWKTASARLDTVPTGKHDIIITLTSPTPVEIDWISFE